MKTKNPFSIIYLRLTFCAALLGAFALTGCVVQPAGAVVVGPPAVYVAPQPVYVGPEVVVPLEIGGGGGRRYYHR